MRRMISLFKQYVGVWRRPWLLLGRQRIAPELRDLERSHDTARTRGRHCICGCWVETPKLRFHVPPPLFGKFAL